MTASPGRVIVFGATSYLGRFVLDALLERGHRIVAVTRNPATAAIPLREVLGRIQITTADQLGPDRADAVINLAYVKQVNPVGSVRNNRALVSAASRAARQTGAPMVVQVSTAAVFGYRFVREPDPGPPPRLAGDSYIELKAQAERRTLALAWKAGYLPVIVRPGNILGPGSPTWVVGPVQRLLEARPVAVEGADGFANATYAPNLADYLAHLVSAEREQLAEFGPYHHLAEFSGVRWSEFHQAFADAAGVEPVLAAGPPAPRSAASFLAQAAARLREAYGGLLGVWMRRALGRITVEGLGDWMYLRLKEGLAAGALEPGIASDAAEQKFLTIVSEPWEFRSHTLPSWHPPVGLGQALAVMRHSLETDGLLPLPGRSR